MLRQVLFLMLLASKDVIQGVPIALQPELVSDLAVALGLLRVVDGHRLASIDDHVVRFDARRGTISDWPHALLELSDEPVIPALVPEMVKFGMALELRIFDPLVSLLRKPTRPFSLVKVLSRFWRLKHSGIITEHLL